MQKSIENFFFRPKMAGIDTGHFRLYAAIQGLKNDHLPNKEFEPTNECFNAVYQI